MVLEAIATINQAVNNFVWGIPAMVCIIGVGLLLSVRTGFLQIRKFPYAIKTTIGRMFRKKDASDGAMTPFQAVCTALAGTVGTGNIAGVAGAIAIGGPGAVFWMWCSALLGMCTKFAEVTLAVHFRERSETGEWVGGPMYYIKNGLGKRWQFLAFLYSLFGVLTVFGTGNVASAHGAGQCGAHRLEGGYGTVRSVLFAEHASDGGFDGVREFANLQKAGAHAQQQTHTNDAHHGGHAPDKIVDRRIDGRDRLDHNSSHILCKVLRSDTFCQRNIKTILPYFCAAVK